jgi:hypothetical protein
VNQIYFSYAVMAVILAAALVLLGWEWMREQGELFEEVRLLRKLVSGLALVTIILGLALLLTTLKLNRAFDMIAKIQLVQPARSLQNQ